MAHKTANICFDCKNACGGCSWSEFDPDTGKVRFQPVDGWDAEEVDLNVGSSGRGRADVVKTYSIKSCPQFEKDEDRHTDRRELTEEQSKWFEANIERILREWADG